MRIQVNGESREVELDITLPRLVASLNLKPEQIAIEVNHDVVRRREWEHTVLQPEDKVEIVHFVGGGCGATTKLGLIRLSQSYKNLCLGPKGR